MAARYFPIASPILFDNFLVAGLNPRRPGDDDASIAPSSSIAGIRGESSGREDSIHGRSDLRPRKSAPNFLENCRQIHVVSRGAPKDLRIGCPSKSLVACEGSPLELRRSSSAGPKDIAPQFVEHGTTRV